MKVLLLALGFMLITTLGVAQDKIMIQVKFKEQTEIGEYNDAIYYIPEGALLTAVNKWLGNKQLEIDTMKSERVNSWIDSVKNPPPYIEPSMEDLKNLRADLIKQVEELNNKITEKDPTEKPIVYTAQ